MKTMARSTAAAGLVTVITPTEIHRSGYRDTRPTPAGTLSDLPFLLGVFAYEAGYTGRDIERTVIVPTLRLPGPLEQCVGEGWSTNPTDGGWYTIVFQHIHRVVVHLGIIDRGALDDLGLVGADPDHIANTLAWWWMWTGAHYRHTPGVAAIASIRAHPRKFEPRWVLKHPATLEAWQPPAQIHAHNINPTAAKVGHQWDMRSAYLAAAAAVELPYRQLRNTGVDPTTLECGYYRVAIPKWPAREKWPAALWPTRDRHGCVWLTAPEYRLWREQHPTAGELVDSWTPHHPERTGHGRILRGWAEDWRDTINQHRGEPLEKPLKWGYAFAIGMMNTPKGTIYRPDWRHFIIGHVRASVARRIIAVHEISYMWPSKVDVDSIYYADNKWSAADIAWVGKGLGVGDEIGRMRYEGEKTP